MLSLLSKELVSKNYVTTLKQSLLLSELVVYRYTCYYFMYSVSVFIVNLLYLFTLMDTVIVCLLKKMFFLLILELLLCGTLSEFIPPADRSCLDSFVSVRPAQPL